MINGPRCPICDTTLIATAPAQNFDGIFNNCPTCGKYIIESEIFNQISPTQRLDLKKRSCMFYFLTAIRKNEIKKNLRTVVFVNSNPQTLDDEDASLLLVNIEDILNLYPNNFDDQLSMILVNLMNHSERPGKQILFFSVGGVYYPHFFFLDPDSSTSIDSEISWWVSELCKMGYLDQNASLYRVTLDGWKKATDFLNKTSNAKTAFIAMSFHPALQSVRAEIKRSIGAAGFIPILIDDKEHNNQIVPEILYEIRKARFLVADFTNQRNGVYYEAGYAEGLGLPVIALCEKNDFDKNMHFDLRQKNIILWEKPEDIYEKLVRRIIATLDMPVIRS